MTTRAQISTRSFTVCVLLIALVVAGIVSYYASGHPDALEHVAGETGFLGSAQDHAVADGPLGDYAVTGVGDARTSVGLAGVIGCAVTFVVALGVSRLVRRS